MCISHVFDFKKVGIGYFQALAEIWTSNLQVSEPDHFPLYHCDPIRMNKSLLLKGLSFHFDWDISFIIVIACNAFWALLIVFACDAQFWQKKPSVPPSLKIKIWILATLMKSYWNRLSSILRIEKIKIRLRLKWAIYVKKDGIIFQIAFYAIFLDAK